MAELLEPFLPAAPPSAALLAQLQVYLELLLRWNARINLTAVRDAETMVTRHFGESLFAAHALFPAGDRRPLTLADVGSGAGFPGLCLKLAQPELRLTLIESHSRKAAFLSEAVRTLGLREVNVFCGRAEAWGREADVVCLRAVEKLLQILPVAGSLVGPGGRLCLLIGSAQLESAQQVVGAGFQWSGPLPVPQSRERIVAIAQHERMS